MPSRAAKAILAVIIILVALGFVWSSWSVALVASIGGMIAFLGLWIEKEADDEEKKEHLASFVDGARDLKVKSKIGWWILMFGIAIEVVTAAGLAVHDVSEAKRFNEDVNRIDPANLPVLNINAFAVLRVKGKEFPDLTQWDSIPISTNWGSKITTAALCENTPNGVLQSIPSMISDDFGIGAEFSDFREYFLEFHMESVSAAMNLPLQSASKSFASANFISINTGFLPPQSEILDGYAFVVINNSLWKLFRIYPQKDPQPPFPNKEQAEMFSKMNLNPVGKIVVSVSNGILENMKIRIQEEPGKILSLTNGEVFPLEGAGIFKSYFTIVGTNVPSGKFDPNW